jgi:hypothetical protein
MGVEGLALKALASEEIEDAGCRATGGVGVWT